MNNLNFFNENLILISLAIRGHFKTKDSIWMQINTSIFFQIYVNLL
jgi:hypothetical protein